jgi:hypothetical protein
MIKGAYIYRLYKAKRLKFSGLSSPSQFRRYIHGQVSEYPRIVITVDIATYKQVFYEKKECSLRTNIKAVNNSVIR